MKSQSGVEVGEHCGSVDEIICLVEVSCTLMKYIRICCWVLDFLFVHGLLMICGDASFKFFWLISA